MEPTGNKIKNTMFNNGLKKKAIERLKNAESTYNELGQDANTIALTLYNTRKSAVYAIERIEKYINSLANSPKEFKKDIAEILLKIKDFQEAIRIEKENASENIKATSTAVGGAAIGGGIAALGPTAAMAIATTFGTASTGAAIASLSGAAATNAALAWLGGGALAAGGGGMAAGNALLALAGPIGWGIAGLGIIGGGLFATYKNKVAAEQADKYTKIVWDKIYYLRPKLEKLRRLNQETMKLKSALNIAEFQLFPKDYTQFNDEQKAKLAALINNTNSMGILINERIA